MGNSVGYRGNLKETDIEYRFIDHYLLPSNPTCIFHDPLHGIIAIGAPHLIKLYGSHLLGSSCAHLVLILRPYSFSQHSNKK